jgi:putative MFS transporter
MTVIEAQPPVGTRRDVEEVLREGGLSPFHRKAVLVTGAAWTFVAMEILLVGFVQAIFAAKWGLNGTWQGLINSSALAGSLCGSLVLGRLADRIGRRTIFQYAILWYAVFTALTAVAWGPWSVMTLRFLAGVGLGGMLVVDPSMLAEYLPPQRRGRMLVFLDLWWPVGLLLATGLSWVFIGHSIGGADAWRWLFLTASFPAFMTFVVRRTLPESPYYLARTGRTDEAASVLSEITGRAVSPGELEAAPASAASSLRELFTRALARTDALMIGVWVALNISYYGLFLWLPFILNGDKFTIDLYLLLTLSALSQFPGYAASIWLVERVGRKPTLAAFLLLGGLSGYAFAAADSATVYVISLFFVGFFNLGAWGALYPYTSELFPTRVRASAFGLLEGVGKAAAIAGPYIFGNLRDATGGTFWPLSFIALVMAGGGVVALTLGRETRGAKLL